MEAPSPNVHSSYYFRNDSTVGTDKERIFPVSIYFFEREKLKLIFS